MGAGCCVDRTALQEPELSLGGKRSQASPSSPQADAKDIPKDLEHQLEWSIVAHGIEQDELKRLCELHGKLQDLEGHPGCKAQPFHRQAQTLLRFLRARDGNVEQAEVMFRNMVNWRQRFRVDEKVQAWRDEMKRFRSRRSHLLKQYAVDVEMCVDKHGIPVRLIRLSVADAAGSWRELGEEALLLESLHQLERTHAQIRKAMFEHQILIRGQVQIIDVGDYGQYGVPNWANRMWAALANGKDMYKIFDANFPETVRKVFIIRTGYLTNTIWRMVLPLVPPRTKKKLRLFGYRAEDWLSELRDELRPGEVLQDFLSSDTAEAYASAEPKGGIIPEGAGGANFGNWEEGGLTPSTPAKEAAHSSRPKGSRTCILAIIVLATALGASLPLLAVDAAPMTT